MPLGILIFAVVVLVTLTASSKAYGYVRGVRVELDLQPIPDGKLMRADAAAAFTRMAAAAAADGVQLHVNRAFATWEQQKVLYDRYLAGAGALAAEPGWSNHQGGIAADIESGAGTNAAFKWLTANAARFSFRRTVPSEPWHWEYRP